MDTSLNPGWKQEGNKAIYTLGKELEVGESITRKIVLKCKGTDYGTKTNIAKVDSTENINPEAQSEAVIIISTKTGNLPIYILLTMTTLTILGGGIYLVKKYVI